MRRLLGRGIGAQHQAVLDHPAMGLVIVCTGLALVLPMHSLEPFLLLLSSVFVPLYGVILGRLAVGNPSFAPPQRKVDITAALLWLVGVAAYHLIAKWAPQWGSALPTLALTFTLAWLTRRKRT